MGHIFGSGAELEWVAAKAALLYLTAIICFRVGRRRTLAEMSSYDFVAAVAVGAIVGRVPNSDSTSYLAGAVTLVSILVLHALITWLRFSPQISRLLDHPPRLIVSQGRLIRKELRRSGLTEKDLAGLLRQHQIVDLDQVAFVILEAPGHLSIFRAETAGVYDGRLVREVVDQARKEQ